MQVIGTYDINFGEGDAIRDLYITHADTITDKTIDNKQVDGVLDLSGLSLYFHDELLLKYAGVPQEMVEAADNIYVIEVDHENEAQLAIKIKIKT